MRYTENEMKILNAKADEIFGMMFEELDDEDQDYIYCQAEEDGEMLHEVYKDFN